VPTTVSPIPLPSTDITISYGQLLADLTLNLIHPGSVHPPAGDSYVVVDNAFSLGLLSASEISEALAMGVSEFIVDGGIVALTPAQTAALNGTPFIAVLTAGEAVFAEFIKPTVPNGETVVVSDTAAHIEALTTSEVNALSTIDVSQIYVSDLRGVGTLKIQDGYTYFVHGAVTSNINFTRSGGTVAFDDTPDMKGTISGFSRGDEIILSDVAYDPHGSVNLLHGNVLEVTENGVTHDIQLDPSQNFVGDYFHLQQDPTAGTDIVENTTPCYCRGTRIATLGGEMRVEELKIGDEVMTRSGTVRPIKWIGRRSFAGRFILGRKDILPVCIKADALGGNVPRRDLWISPHHAMFFAGDDGACAEGVLIEAKDLVNCRSIVQAGHTDKVEYFHIELDSHDVIIAEGALSETFIDDDSRGMFHNAQEFSALYPQLRVMPQQYCAPRLEDGYEVEAIRCRIAVQAELLPSADWRGDVTMERLQAAM
jgi:hypothetical protein